METVIKSCMTLALFLMKIYCKILRVPLKTALNRENEIAASNTRKADEAGLAPG